MVLQPIADVYVRLMQMTVLPYLVLCLVIGFGQLEAVQTRRLARRAGGMLVLTSAAAPAGSGTEGRSRAEIPPGMDRRLRVKS